jgi:hypothetical protein
VGDQSLAARRIIARYRARLRSAFPTADIIKLIPGDIEATGLLHGRIDLYLAGITGYASSADRLGQRPEQDLRAARQFLSQAFFDKYPEYAPLRAKITPQHAPSLFLEMQAAELNRIDLLEEVERLLERCRSVAP